MISFIVIGRNEGWKLSLCFQSIFDTIEKNKIKNFEIIYIDSHSTDDSIKRAKEFSIIKIFRIVGKCNAAIGRNIGVKAAKGKTLVFIDGDMEIISDAFSIYYTEAQGLIYPFVSGNWDNYYYNTHWEFLRKDNGALRKKDIMVSTTGGMFFIEKELWTQVSGMRQEFKISQDIDLALRIAKKGTLILRKKEILVHHHTIAYLDNIRMWKDFFSGNQLYARSFLYRKNIFNRYIYPRIVRNDYSLLVLIFTSVLSIWCNLCFLLYIFLLLIKSVKKARNSFLELIKYFGYYLLRDITTLLGLFFFIPKRIKQIDYIEI